MSAPQLAVIIRQPEVPAVTRREEIQLFRQAAQWRAEELKAKATAERTRAAYAADWAHFSNFCEQLEVSPLPASVDTVKEYLAALPSMPQSSIKGRGRRKESRTGYSVATITRRLASISRTHKRAGFPSPCGDEEIREVLRGVRREVGPGNGSRDAILTDDFHPLTKRPQTLKQFRDRALLLFGFASAMRRSELSALDVSDLRFDAGHVFAAIRRSKTDQQGKGREVCVNVGRRLCAVTALREWLEAAGINEGPVFRGVGKGRPGRIGSGRLTGASINLIVQRYCRTHGVEGVLGAHSLRAGFVTQAKIGGASDYSIQLQTGHTSSTMIDRYTRRYNLAANNASGKLGL